MCWLLSSISIHILAAKQQLKHMWLRNEKEQQSIDDLIARTNFVQQGSIESTTARLSSSCSDSLQWNVFFFGGR